MSEITKLYENAGIKGEWRDYRVKNGKVYDGKNPKNRNIRLCKPRFTAEKQLELIKWLIKYDELHTDFNDNEYGFSTLNYSGKYKKDFEESLASIINNELWQDLSEEEKQQVKGILG